MTSKCTWCNYKVRSHFQHTLAKMLIERENKKQIDIAFSTSYFLLWCSRTTFLSRRHNWSRSSLIKHIAAGENPWKLVLVLNKWSFWAAKYIRVKSELHCTCDGILQLSSGYIHRLRPCLTHSTGLLCLSLWMPMDSRHDPLFPWDNTEAIGWTEQVLKEMFRLQNLLCVVHVSKLCTIYT